jgi:hypothetical protein
MYQTLSLSTLTLEVKLVVRDCSRNIRENGAMVVLESYLKRTEGRSEGVKQAGRSAARGFRRELNDADLAGAKRCFLSDSWCGFVLGWRSRGLPAAFVEPRFVCLISSLH